MWEEWQAVHALEERIEAAVEEVGGQHDGHEFGGGEAVVFTSGPDADALLDAVQKRIADFALPPGAYAVTRYGSWGDPEAPKHRVALEPPHAIQ